MCPGPGRVDRNTGSSPARDSFLFIPAVHSCSEHCFLYNLRWDDIVFFLLLECKGADSRCFSHFMCAVKDSQKAPFKKNLF